MVMSRTRTGTPTTASTSTGTTSTIAMTTSVLARSFTDNAAQWAALRYFIQPLVILDSSWRSNSSSRYLSLGIMFSSLTIRISLFSSSILVLAVLSRGSFEFFDSRAAVIINWIVSRQIFSIFMKIPSLSFFGNLELNK